MNEYNGWTNYETWLVNIEMGLTDDPLYFEARNLGDLIVELKDLAENLIESDNKLATYFSRVILSKVDWIEIAEFVLERLMDIENEIR